MSKRNWAYDWGDIRKRKGNTEGQWLHVVSDRDFTGIRCKFGEKKIVYILNCSFCLVTVLKLWLGYLPPLNPFVNF